MHPDMLDVTVNPLSAGEVMKLHVETGYQHDGKSRLTAINDRVQRPVPRYWLGRSAEGVMWRFRHDLPDLLCEELETISRNEKTRETPSDYLFGPTLDAAKYQAILDRHEQTSTLWNGPV